MLESIKKFFQERGDLSSMRLALVFATVVIVSSVCGVFVYVGLKTVKVPDIPAGVAAFAGVIITALAGAKAYQKKIEGQKEGGE